LQITKFTPKKGDFVRRCVQEVKDMKRLPFSLFKRNNSRYYYVKFKNDETGDYLPAVSTKQESEAIKLAFDWLKNGIPKNGETVSHKQYSLRDMAKAVT
jgi:hypothetical protein